MAAFARAVRFFHTLELPHPVVTGGLLFVTAAAVVALAVNPALAPATARAVLMLQVLACSSGFAPAARRGHYDLALTMGLGRSAIALAHWCVSAWPGIAAWLALTVTEVVVSHEPFRLLRTGELATLFVSSTLPWALTVPFPRLTGGLTLIMLALSASAVVPRELHMQWAMLLRAAESEAAATAATLSIVALLVAVRFIHRMDVPLEAQ